MPKHVAEKTQDERGPGGLRSTCEAHVKTQVQKAWVCSPVDERLGCLPVGVRGSRACRGVQVLAVSSLALMKRVVRGRGGDNHVVLDCVTSADATVDVDEKEAGKG